MPGNTALGYTELWQAVLLFIMQNRYHILYQISYIGYKISNIGHRILIQILYPILDILYPI